MISNSIFVIKLFKRRGWVFLIGVFFLFVSTSSGQSLRFEHLTIENGLSQNQIFYLFQDSRNFLWISTSNGLNRYDGSTFKIYRSNPDDPSTISGNTFKCIIEDDEHNLWIASNGGGLSKYVRKLDSFIRYKATPNDPNTPPGDRINALLIDRQGFLWIGSETGLSRMNLKTGKYYHFGVNKNNRDSLCDKRIYSLFEDSSGKVWVGTWQGLSVYDPLTKKFGSYFRNVSNPNSLYSDYILKTYEDKQKNIWICTTVGLHLFNPKTNSFKRFLADSKQPYSLNNDDIVNLIEDRKGNIWIATNYGGLNLYDRKSGRFYHYTNNPNDIYSLNNNSVLSILEDNSGLIWLGTNGGGLNKLDLRITQFKHYRSTAGTKNTLSANNVSSALVDKNNSIWIGTLAGGLNKLVRKNQQTTFYHYMNNPNNNNTISSGQVYAIALDKENNLWIGTETGLNKFNEKENKFVHFNPLNNSSMLNHSVFSVIVDRDDNVWIGTYGGGFSMLQKKTNKFINYTHSEKNLESISSNIVRHILEDSKGRMWISTENGLNLFDKHSQKFYCFKKDPADHNSIIDNFILFAHEDSKKNIWVGTPYGLCKLIDDADPEKIKFGRLTVLDGLPGTNIQGMEEDDHGNLWISTNNGISKYNPSNKTFRNFNVSDGLQGREFYVLANAKIKSTGELFFGGDNGFNIFHPDSVSDDEYIPPVVFTEFHISNLSVPVNKEVDGKIILEKSISETEDLYLSYSQKDISFEYAALYFVNSAENRYKYFLEGLDKEWKDIGNRRFVTFNNLPSGDYILHVTACNHNGVWNSRGAYIRIHVSPPYWETWYFRLLFVLFCLIGLVSLYKYKTRNIAKRSLELQNEVKKQTAELREAKDFAEAANKSKSDFLANISHELRTPLNAIMGYAQLLRKHTNLTEVQKDQLFTIQKSGEHLLTLINDILELRKIEVKKEEVNYSEFNLQSLIHEVLSTIRVKALEKSLEFTYEENPTVPKFIINDSKKIKQILINLLGNGIKYTNTGGVKLFVEGLVKNETISGAKSQWIKFIITDSGIGIPKNIAAEIFQPFGLGERSKFNVEGSGLGLAISKRLVELLGGNLTFQSEEGVGSVFTFELEVEVVADTFNENIVATDLIIGCEGQRKNVLIVDDNSTNRSMLASYLEPLGFHVEMAEDGKDALEKLINIKPDIILLDFLMPRIDGINFMNAFRSNPENEKIKVIGVSAAVADKERIEVFSARCDAFISKPVDLLILINKISSLLDLKLIKQESDGKQTFGAAHETSSMIYPTPEILNEIIEVVNLGNYSGVEKILQRIEIEDDTYKIFCERIREYSKHYNDEAIIYLCQNK